MFSLEDKLRPKCPPAPAWRDVLGAGLIVVLAVALLWGWGHQMLEGLAELNRTQDQAGRQDLRLGLTQSLAGRTSLMLSPLLPVALGFALALRVGAIDLSVWANAALGGAVAAAAINAGAAPGWALAAGAGAGAAVGAVSGVLIALARLPSVAVTLAAAVVVVVSVTRSVGSGGLAVGEFAFDEWINLPLWTLRMLLVAGAWGVVMCGLVLARSAGHPGRWSERTRLFAALCASGALAAVGGACRLFDYSQACPPRLIGDLRVPAAAVLAGAAFFAGGGRTILVGLWLPVTLLLACRWRQEVWDWQARGYLLQLGLLVVMTVGTHAALAGVSGARRRWPVVAGAGVLCVAGMVVVTFSGGSAPYATGLWALWTGAGLWVAGVIWTVVGRARRTEASCGRGGGGERR